MIRKSTNMVSKRLMISDQEQYQKYYKFAQKYQPLNDYIKENELSKDTKYRYYGAMASYCSSQDEFFDKLIEEAQKEEETGIPLVERKVHERLDIYKEFLKNEGYKDKTIDRRVKVIRSFYRMNNVTLIENNRALEINPEIHDHIKNSDIFKRFVAAINLENEGTIGGYLTSLTGYCDYYNMTIEELIQEADEEEENAVRLSKRKIKNRLIEYRNHLSKHYANSTIRTKMSDITYFYVINDIEIPKLPKANYPYEPELSFKEIPTINHVKRALETTTSIKNRALILFCLTSGSSSHEARSLSVREYMLGTKECHGETTDIEKALEKMEGNMEFIPVFHLVREKRKRDYYTCITPEANQYIINYLKTRDQLSLDDKVFDYSRKSLINAFEHINDTNNWGWVNNNRQRMFTCHQLRRLNANIIDNGKLVHMIQGKKFDPTVRAYFKQDPKKVRAKYMKEVRKLTIYEKYKTHTLTDENYAEMQEKIEEKESIIQKQEEKIKDLEEKAEASSLNQESLKNQVADLSETIKEMNRYGKHLNDEVPINVEVKKSVDAHIQELRHFSYALFDDEAINQIRGGEPLTNLEKQIMSFSDEELLTVKELSYEIATKEEEFDGTYTTLNKIITKAIIRMKRNPNLIIKVTQYYEDLENKKEKHLKIFNLVNEKIDELGLWDDEESEKLKERIVAHIVDNKKYIYKEVDEDLIMDLIEQFALI